MLKLAIRGLRWLALNDRKRRGRPGRPPARGAEPWSDSLTLFLGPHSPPAPAGQDGPAAAAQTPDETGLPPSDPHRRKEPRYRAVEDRVWVEWWNGGEFTGLSARMLNVSRGGAMIEMGVCLEKRQTVQMVLEDATTGVSVEAEVRGAELVRGGVFQTRLEFTSDCPEPFFEAAANGFEAWLAGSRVRA